MIDLKFPLFVFWCFLAGSYLILALVTRSYYKKIKNVEVTSSLTERGEFVFGKQELGSVGIADSFKKLSKIDLIGFFLASMAALITGITLFIYHQELCFLFSLSLFWMVFIFFQYLRILFEDKNRKKDFNRLWQI